MLLSGFGSDGKRTQPREAATCSTKHLSAAGAQLPVANPSAKLEPHRARTGEPTDRYDDVTTAVRLLGPIRFGLGLGLGLAGLRSAMGYGKPYR